MATYHITGPDGKSYELTGPAGASDADLIAQVQKQTGSQQQAIHDAAAQSVANDPITKGAQNFAADMPWYQKFGAGYGKFTNDVLNRGAQIGAGIADTVAPRSPTLSGLVTGQDPSRSAGVQRTIDQTAQTDKALMDTGWGRTGNIVGSSAPMVAASFIPGVNTVAGGAAAGGLYGGLTEPVESGHSQLGPAALDAALGAAGPIVARAAPGVIKAIAPYFSKSGKENAVGSILAPVLGSDLSKIGQSNAATPGWNQTLAEATQDPAVAALQRSAAATSPTVVGKALATRQLDQNAAAVKALQGVAGTPEDQAMARGVRNYMSGPLYDQAAAQGIDPAIAKAMAPQIENLMGRPSMQTAIANAKRIYGEKAITLDPQGDVGGLQLVKQTLDDMVQKAGSPASAIGKNELNALQQTRSDLISTLQDLSPTLRQADTNYATFSKPINEQNAAQSLYEGLVPALTNPNTPTRLRPQAYADALRNLSDKIPGLTGFPGATVENTMSPGGMNTLNGLRTDLMNRSTAQDLASLATGGGSPTAGNLSGKELLQEGTMMAASALPHAGVLQGVGMLAKRAIQGPINKVMADALTNPAYAAQIVAKAQAGNPKAALAIKALQRIATPAAVIGAPYALQQ